MRIDDFERVCEEHDKLTEQVASLTRQLAEAREQIEKLTRMLTGDGGLSQSRYIGTTDG